jgi:hypothetical protein
MSNFVRFQVGVLQLLILLYLIQDGSHIYVRAFDCFVTDGSLSSPITVSADDKYSVQHKTENADTLVVVLSSKSDIGWLGFGFPEQNSGSMIGADLVSVIFREDGSATAVDRHVPSVTFPFAPYGVNAAFQVDVNKVVPTWPSLQAVRDCENNGTDVSQNHTI